MLRKSKVMRLECGRKFYCAVIRSTSAPHCVVSKVPSRVEAGTRVVARIVARDMFDERITRGGDHFSVSLLHAWDDTVVTVVDLDDNFDGTYDCSFRLMVLAYRCCCCCVLLLPCLLGPCTRHLHLE